MRFFSAFVLVGASFGTLVQAAEGERHSLSEFLALAETQGAQLSESMAKVEGAQARLDFARSKAQPTAEIESLFGVLPGAHGDPLNGRTDWGEVGPFSSSKITLTQPLYAWGGLSAARSAARAGLEAEKKLLEKDKWALRTQVTELYYGYQLAFELSEVADNLESKLSQALSRMEKNSKSRAGDRKKVRGYLQEVRVRKGEAQKGLDQARLGMAWKIGTYGKSYPKWDRANLLLRDIALKDLKFYQDLALQHRPELVALAKELEARQDLVRVEQAQQWPVIFAAARVEHAVAPERDNQRSPFAYDPANTFSAGAALGIKWNFGIFEANAKVGQVRAESRQAEGKSRHLRAGVMAEVEKTYLDLRYALEAMKLREDGAKDLKRDYQDALAQLALGTGDGKTFLENLGNFTMAEKSRLESIYQVNLQAAKLEQSVGASL